MQNRCDLSQATFIALIANLTQGKQRIGTCLQLVQEIQTLHILKNAWLPIAILVYLLAVEQVGNELSQALILKVLELSGTNLEPVSRKLENIWVVEHGRVHVGVWEAESGPILANNSFHVVDSEAAVFDLEVVRFLSAIVFNWQGIFLELFILLALLLVVLAGDFEQALSGFHASRENHLSKVAVVIGNSGIANSFDQQPVRMIVFQGVSITHD